MAIVARLLRLEPKVCLLSATPRIRLNSGMPGVLNELAQGTIAGADVGADVLVLARVAEARMGGTSGALYSIFFSALAAALSAQQRPSQAATPEVWAHAARAALDKLYTYTRARPPSRTLVDPLAAFVLALEADPADVTSAVQQAGEAAEKTRELQAKAGRAAYVEEERLKEDSVPDPGAWGVKVILEALFA
jgi:dihydroxyacetone kinase